MKIPIKLIMIVFTAIIVTLPSATVTMVLPSTNEMPETPSPLSCKTRAQSTVFIDEFNDLSNWNRANNDGNIGVSDGIMYEVGKSNNGIYEDPTIWLKNPIPAFGAPAYLRFSAKFSRDDFYKKGWTEVKVSTDGSNWAQVWSRGSDMGWTQIDVDISQYAGSALYILIHTHTATDKDYIQMDWIRIDATTNTAPSPPTSISPTDTYDKTPTISWSGASDPEGDTLSYEIQIGTQSGGSDILSWTSTGTSAQYTVSSPLAPGVYFVQVRSYDGEYYSSIYESQMTVSNNPPQPPANILPDTTGSRKPQISWDAAIDPDQDDTITEYQIRIGTTSGGDDFLSWTSTGTSTLYNVVDTMEFTTYYVQVKAYDGYAWSSVTEETLLIDASANSPPNAPTDITPDESYDVTPRISWTASTDPDGDDIVDYQIRIGTSSGLGDVLNWTSTGGNRYYDVTSALEVGTYYVQVKAFDGNSWSGAYEEALNILNTAPNPPTVAKADGYTLPTMVTNKKPTITWSGATDINTEQTLSYYIMVNTTSSTIMDWTYTTDTYYTIVVELPPGAYMVNIKTFDGFENSSVLSADLAIGNTPPPRPTWILPDNTTSKSPEIDWESVSDSDGDDVSYFVQIGTSSGGSDVISWTEESSPMYIFNRTIEPGNYYVQVKSYDGYDYSSVLEEIMVIQNNPPSAPEDIQPHSTSQTSPLISWTPSIDLDYDEVTYYIQIGSASGSGDILPWYNTQGNTSFQVPYVLDYGTYYVQVKAFDFFDYSAVKEIAMNIAQNANTPPNRPTTLDPDVTNTTTPLLDWDDCEDVDGDTVTYEVKAGTSPGGSDIFDWQTATESFYQVPESTPLHNGINYINIRAYDGTDYSTVFEDTITVDLGINYPPGEVSNIRPTTTVLRTPEITWDPATDPNGDPLTYYIRIGTTSGGAEVLDWTSTGSSTSYAVENPLEPGTYYVQVKASDGELEGNAVESVLEIRSTNSPPTPPNRITPTETKEKTPTIYWYGASDPDMDVLQYELRIGTTSNGSEVLDWISTGENNYYAISDGSPLDYGTYYIQIKAFDGSDYSDVFQATLVVSETANSPPMPPTSFSPQSTPDTTPTIHWYGASDPDGDTLSYWIAIGTSEGDTNILGWTHVEDTQYTLTIKLSPGSYYIMLVAFDGEQNSTVFTGVLDIVLQGNRAPTSPTMISPTETYDKRPNITWSGAEDADGDLLFYWIRISTSYYGGDVVPWTFTGSREYFNVPVDLEPGTYSVFVLAFDGIDNASMPTGSILTVYERVNHAPTEPTGITPEETTSTRPTISWTGATDQDGDTLTYWIAVGTTVDSEDVMGWTFLGEAENYTFTHNLSIGRYYIFIIASDGQRNSSTFIGTLDVVTPFTYSFEAALEKPTLDVEGAKVYTVTITVKNTGTGDDTYNITVSGSLDEYVYIKEKANPTKLSDATAFAPENRYMAIHVGAGEEKVVTLVIMLPSTERFDDVKSLSINITSLNSGQAQTLSLGVEMNKGDSQWSEGALSGSTYTLLPLLILIIIVGVFLFIWSNKKKEKKEDSLDLSDDDFKETFEDLYTDDVPVGGASGTAGAVKKGGKSVASSPRKDRVGADGVKPKKAPKTKKKEEAEKGERVMDLSSLDMSDLDSELASMEESELESLREKGR